MTVVVGSGRELIPLAWGIFEQTNIRGQPFESHVTVLGVPCLPSGKQMQIFFNPKGIFFKYATYLLRMTCYRLYMRLYAAFP